MLMDPSPVEAIERFVASLREIRTRLFDDLFPIVGVADLQVVVRSRRELPREGVTSSGIEYLVHGAGCRMIGPDGREVDVDIVADPELNHYVEAFDPWRVRWFLDQAAGGDFGDEAIATACEHLARQGLTRESLKAAGTHFLSISRSRPAITRRWNERCSAASSFAA